MFNHSYSLVDGNRIEFKCSQRSNVCVYESTLRESVFQNTYNDSTTYQIPSSKVLAFEITPIIPETKDASNQTF